MAKDTNRVLIEKDTQLFTSFIIKKTANRSIIMYSPLTRLEKRKKNVPWVQRILRSRNINHIASEVINN